MTKNYESVAIELIDCDDISIENNIMKGVDTFLDARNSKNLKVKKNHTIDAKRFARLNNVKNADISENHMNVSEAADYRRSKNYVQGWRPIEENETRQKLSGLSLSEFSSLIKQLAKKV